MDLVAPWCLSGMTWLASGAAVALICVVAGAAWGWQLRVVYELDVQ